MVEKDTIFSGKVKQKGIFEFAELYRITYNWLLDENYDVTEKVYREKINPNGKEVLIEWEARRKISDYFRFVLKIRWYIIGMTDVEVEKNGKKIKMNNGYPEIGVKAILEKDYENRWEDKPFFKFLRGVYDKYIIRGRIDDYEGKIHAEADEFLAQVKAYLALEGRH